VRLPDIDVPSLIGAGDRSRTGPFLQVRKWCRIRSDQIPRMDRFAGIEVPGTL